MPPEAVRLGLDGVKRIEFVWGFQDDALRSVIRAVAPSPRRGILALFDQPTFTIDALPPLPPELTGFSVFSIDLAKTYDKAIEILKTTRPEMADQIPAIEGAVEQQLGVNLRNDILGRLGPKLSFYMENPTGVAGNPMLAMFNMFSGITFSFEVRDEPALSKSLETLISRVNDILKQQQAAQGGDAPAVELVKLREPQQGLRGEPPARHVAARPVRLAPADDHARHRSPRDRRHDGRRAEGHGAQASRQGLEADRLVRHRGACACRRA